MCWFKQMQRYMVKHGHLFAECQAHPLRWLHSSSSTSRGHLVHRRPSIQHAGCGATQLQEIFQPRRELILVANSLQWICDKLRHVGPVSAIWWLKCRSLDFPCQFIIMWCVMYAWDSALVLERYLLYLVIAFNVVGWFCLIIVYGPFHYGEHYETIWNACFNFQQTAQHPYCQDTLITSDRHVNICAIRVGC